MAEFEHRSIVTAKKAQKNLQQIAANDFL